MQEQKPLTKRTDRRSSTPLQTTYIKSIEFTIWSEEKSQDGQSGIMKVPRALQSTLIKFSKSPSERQGRQNCCDERVSSPAKALAPNEVPVFWLLSFFFCYSPMATEDGRECRLVSRFHFLSLSHTHTLNFFKVFFCFLLSEAVVGPLDGECSAHNSAL